MGIRGRLILIVLLTLAGSTGHAQVLARRDLASLVQAIDLALPASADALGRILGGDIAATRSRLGWNLAPRIYQSSDGYSVRVALEAGYGSTAPMRIVRTTLGIDPPACVDEGSLRRKLTERAGWTWRQSGSHVHVARPHDSFVEISTWPASVCVIGIVIDTNWLIRLGPVDQPKRLHGG